MCGLAGYVDRQSEPRAARQVLERMVATLTHRGPDSAGYYMADGVALGFRRLSIIDLETGDQPIYNEDRSIALVCNGEIYNYLDLRDDLIKEGHTFRSNSDVEVLVHLYESYGPAFLNKLNGQFALALYDGRQRTLLLARDHFGINPLYYATAGGVFLFASEIKALLEHPLIRPEVDLMGLDQTLTLPGLVSPTTMFKGVKSLKKGHYIVVKESGASVNPYWDLDYPRVGEISYDKPEQYYVERVADLITRSVRRRLQADVPVGFYLSGGLDSSLIAATINQVSPQLRRHSFSIAFTDQQICESKYQRIVAGDADSLHHEIVFDWPEILERLSRMIYHCECPVKETYNTCSLALSESARRHGIKVILTGEGADELFAGYVGYRFDQFGIRSAGKNDLETRFEEQLREQLWGDKQLFYETDFYSFNEVKALLYSAALNEQFEEFNCLNAELVDKDRLRGRHVVHQRSYLDFNLRLSDHLIADHGDRMAMANSVEARYPFLDIDLIEFSRFIPPDLKLNQFTEKYVLKKAAQGRVPQQIIDREKFGFHAPGSPYLLQQNSEWINDLLSAERIKKDGYFNPQAIERLKSRYSQEGFRLNLPFEPDLLIVVLTFNIFLDTFRLSGLN